MSITRRDLLLAGAVAAGSTFVSRSAKAAEPAGKKGTGTSQTPFSAAQNQTGSEPVSIMPKPKAQLKLSSQLGIIPGGNLAEKLAQMETWGFDGVELGGDAVGNTAKYAEALKNSKLKPSVICGAKGTANGHLVSDNVELRGPAADDIRRALDAAGKLGMVGVILVPAFNGQTKLTNQEIRKVLVETLPKLGEHAAAAGTHLILEPLNRKEAFFLRLVADAAAIVRDCPAAGLAVMGDFYHMCIEEPSDLGAFISGGALVHHVHLASRERVLPGQDSRQFIDGFRGLKWIGYDDYCSFECGVRGEAKVEIPKSLAFLRQQWEQA